MALGDPYVSTAELAAYVNAPNTDPLIGQAANAASSEIIRHCHRDFNSVTAVSARRFKPSNPCLVKVTDFQTITGLIVKTDTTGDGTYDTTWTSSDYELEPADGIVGGSTGWPFNEIHAVEALQFPCGNKRPRSVQVTAKWGWSAVPADVKTACFILAAQLFDLKNSPMGVAGSAEFGVIRVRAIPQVEALLQPYVDQPVMVA